MQGACGFFYSHFVRTASKSVRSAAMSTRRKSAKRRNATARLISAIDRIIVAARQAEKAKADLVREHQREARRDG